MLVTQSSVGVNRFGRDASWVGGLNTRHFMSDMSVAVTAVTISVAGLPVASGKTPFPAEVLSYHSCASLRLLEQVWPTGVCQRPVSR
jgi:hypothetical protein